MTSSTEATSSPTASTAIPLVKRRLIVALTGASGAIYGIRLLQLLRTLADVEVHLVISAAGWLNIHHELDITREEITSLATYTYNNKDIGASIASGSFHTDGMIIIPCSMKTLAAVAHGIADNLITRAADVVLKERRRLVVMPRETPLNLAHLRNMVAITEMGGIIFPPAPAFYQRPQTINDLVDYNVKRALDLFNISPPFTPAWPGLNSSSI